MTHSNVPEINCRAYRTFLFCPLCLASFLSLLIAQLVLGKRFDQEGKCLELMSFFRILNTPREFFVGSRRKLINMLRSVQNIHVETAYGGLSQVHWPSLPGHQANVLDQSASTVEDARTRNERGPISDLDSLYVTKPAQNCEGLKLRARWLSLRRCLPLARNNSIYISH